MSQEILYTSAPQGLKPGSRGFCTVQSTSGMAKNLADRLESLSGYRHAFPPHSPDASLNPVNCSHLVLTIGGRKYHVLSRIADAGQDYTQRSNKLAHHVALDEDELVAGGPAWVLAQPGFCESAWDGQTRILPAGRKPSLAVPVAAPCRKWEELTRDAGWAGVLAETALDRNAGPVSILFRPGMPTLGLVVEAMNLLPPEQRWGLTFSTYFTKLPAGVDCRWRFLMDGSVEARAVRRNFHAFKIDLCGPLGSARGGPLVEAARDGRPEPWQSLTAMPPALNKPLLPRSPAVPAVIKAAHTPTVSAPPIAAPPLFPAGPTDQALRERFVQRKRSKRRTVGLAVGLFTLITGGLFAAYYSGVRHPSGWRIPDPPNRETESILIASSEIVEPDRLQPRNQARVIDQPQQSEDEHPDHKPIVEPPVDSIHDPAPPAAAPRQRAEPSEPRPQPFVDIRRRKSRLILPPRSIELGGDQPGGNAGRPVELAKLFVDAPTPCELSIVGSDVFLPQGQTFEIVADAQLQNQPNRSQKEPDSVSPEPSHRARHWKVVLKSNNSIAQDLHVATLRLVDDRLSFQWEKHALTHQRELPLRFCLLQIRVGDEKELCGMSEPVLVEPALLDLSVRRQPVEMSLPVDAAVVGDALRCDVALAGFPQRYQLARDRGLRAGQSAMIRIFEPGERAPQRYPLLEVDLKLEPDRERIRWMQTVALAEAIMAKIDPQPKTRLPRAWFEEIRVSSARALRELNERLDEIERRHEAAVRKLKLAADVRADFEAKAPKRPGDYATEKQREDYRARRQAFEVMLKPYQDREAVAAGEVALTAKDERDCRSAIAHWQTVDSWAEQTLAHLDEIVDKARIHFRFYTTIANRQVELLRTSGAPF